MLHNPKSRPQQKLTLTSTCQYSAPVSLLVSGDEGDDSGASTPTDSGGSPPFSPFSQRTSHTFDEVSPTPCANVRQPRGQPRDELTKA
jgi:hypothetical protein